MHTDFQSDVFQRAIHKKNINLEQKCWIITMVTQDRTLDVELLGPDHAPLAQALQILIEFYNESLPQWQANMELASPDSRRASRTGSVPGNYNVLDDEQYTTSLLHAFGESGGRN